MNESELAWVRWNFESEQGQKDNSSEISAQRGFMLALTDSKTWMFMAMLYAVSTRVPDHSLALTV